MDEMRYQLDYLQAVNKKLTIDRDVYAEIVNTSGNGLFYYYFEDNTFNALGNYNYFFKEQRINTIRDLYEILDQIESLDGNVLNHFLFPERYQEKYNEIEIALDDIWALAKCHLIIDEDGNPHAKIISFHDNTKLYLQNKELMTAVYYDKTTGMNNREYFVMKLMEWVAKAEREEKTITVANIDIDDFRKINDGISIMVGDELIQVFGQYLSEICNHENIMVSRFNGDQFYIAIYDPVGRRNIGYIHELIRERLERPLRLTQLEINISVSVGVCDYPEGGKNAPELINNSEIVMFQAKHQGKGRIKYFDKSIVDAFRKDIELEDRLKAAYKNKEFFMYYQPQFDAYTGDIRGWEALLRWKTSDGKMIPPDVFIPLAEKTGLIIPIGDQAMEMSMAALAEWKKYYHDPLFMCINVSAVQFRNEYFQSHIQGLIQKYHINPAEIEIEITESVFSEDFDAMIRKLMALKSFGIRISIDDFGTGYSSLSYLKNLPVETLKIDRSFVENMSKGNKDYIILSNVLAMTQQLGYETIAEGVENEEQLEHLKEMGCDVIQGYLLGKPVSKEDALNKLKEIAQDKNHESESQFEFDLFMDGNE